jgi:hypothetical protein
MSTIIFSCVDNIFNNNDYNNIKIRNYLLNKHNKKDNAWISIDKNVYSIRKDDYILLELFKNYYGKNVKNFILEDESFKNNKNRILILEKLEKRKIGKLID